MRPININSPLYYLTPEPCRKGHTTPEGKGLRYLSSKHCVYCTQLLVRQRPKKGGRFLIQGELEAKVLELHQQGYSTYRIARECYLSWVTVRNYLKRRAAA